MQITCWYTWAELQELDCGSCEESDISAMFRCLVRRAYRNLFIFGSDKACQGILVLWCYVWLLAQLLI
jgi:hypothetical protein